MKLSRTFVVHWTAYATSVADKTLHTVENQLVLLESPESLNKQHLEVFRGHIIGFANWLQKNTLFPDNKHLIVETHAVYETLNK